MASRQTRADRWPTPVYACVMGRPKRTTRSKASCRNVHACLSADTALTEQIAARYPARFYLKLRVLRSPAVRTSDGCKMRSKQKMGNACEPRGKGVCHPAQGSAWDGVGHSCGGSLSFSLGSVCSIIQFGLFGAAGGDAAFYVLRDSLVFDMYAVGGSFVSAPRHISASICVASYPFIEYGIWINAMEVAFVARGNISEGCMTMLRWGVASQSRKFFGGQRFQIQCIHAAGVCVSADGAHAHTPRLQCAAEQSFPLYGGQRGEGWFQGATGGFCCSPIIISICLAGYAYVYACSSICAF
jgi:hypothetical protein